MERAVSSKEAESAMQIEKVRMTKKTEVMNTARDLSNEGKYKEALPYLEQAAKLGFAEANYALSTWYHFGRVVRKDIKKAVKYAKFAAIKGHSTAAFNYAVSLEKGEGVRKNLKLAHVWYKKAFKAGEKDAAEEIARTYYFGIGTKKNWAMALKFYKIAARSGDKEMKKIVKTLSLEIKEIKSNKGSS